MATSATQYSTQARTQLQETINYLRDGVGEVDDVQAKALFETAAKCWAGSRRAFADFERGAESAWQRQNQ